MPPSVPGAITTGSVQYAPKMQVLGIPAGTLPGSGHVGTNESPIGNGCVRAVFIRGSCGTGRSSMPTSGLPFVRSRMYMKPGLAGMHQDFPQRSAIAHVGEHRRGRAVVVPDVVVHFLEVPLVRAGLQIERDDRYGEQVVAAARGAVVVGTGVADRRRTPFRGSGSIAGWVHTGPPPYFHESPSQVSWPRSPGPGNVQNFQTSLPVFAS